MIQSPKQEGMDDSWTAVVAARPGTGEDTKTSGGDSDEAW